MALKFVDPGVLGWRWGPRAPLKASHLLRSLNLNEASGAASLISTLFKVCPKSILPKCGCKRGHRETIELDGSVYGKKKSFIGDQAAKVISGAVWQGEEQNIEKVGRVYTAAGGVF